MALPPHLPRPREHPDPREPQTLEARFVISSRPPSKAISKRILLVELASACLARAATSSLHDAARRSRAPTAPARSSAGRAPPSAKSARRSSAAGPRTSSASAALSSMTICRRRPSATAAAASGAPEEWVEHRARGAHQRRVGRRARGEGGAHDRVDHATVDGDRGAPFVEGVHVMDHEEDICCGARQRAVQHAEQRATPRPRSARASPPMYTTPLRTGRQRSSSSAPPRRRQRRRRRRRRRPSAA